MLELYVSDGRYVVSGGRYAPVISYQ